MSNNEEIKSIYIHVPFCNTICSYCDFSKLYYNEKWVDDYLEALKYEIEQKYNDEGVKTLYIGGGTPSSLNLKQLKNFFDILRIIKLENCYEYTFECNIENLDSEKLKLLYENKVNRLSIGVQTFNENHLKYLNRKNTKDEVVEKINLAKKIGFKNISIDLIYAIPNQTIDELSKDIDEFLKLDINHISTYSLIIEKNTKLYIDGVENIEDCLDNDMYNLICDKLESNGFSHYETSNFSKPGFESKHNLTYWNNLNYYGFGLGASGYINDIRYENTRSIKKYLNKEFIFEKAKLDENEKIENEFILGFRKIKGINKKNFYNKYKRQVTDFKVVNKLIKEGKLIDDGENIFINKKYVYLSNSILIDFIGVNNE